MSTEGRPNKTVEALVVGAAETLLAALALFAMDGLAHLRLSVPEFFACWACWPVCQIAARGLRRWRAVPGWLARLVETVAPGVLLSELNHCAGGGLTLGQMVYAVVLVACLVQAWRAWLAWAAARGHQKTVETPRLIVAGAAGVWAMLPFFTDRLVGGVDARWYAYMLSDFVTQWRAGVFPVFVGQGELAFNGGVHPFRSAPFFQYWAGLWDLLTLHVLSAVALQHLAAIAIALGGALGMYAVLTDLAPARRWLASGVAVIYVTSPAFLAPIYLADQYMTYMTVATMLPVIYGNMCIFQGRVGRGWPWVGAGLTLVWLSHPPVAILCTLTTAALQGGRLLLADLPAREWRLAAGGAILFLLLSCFYFTSMAEVPSPVASSARSMALQLAGAGLAVIGVARGVVWRQRWAWPVLVLGLGLLGWTQPAWLKAMVIAAVMAGIAAGMARRRRWFEPRAHGWLLLAGALLLAGLLTPLVWGGPFPEESLDKQLALLHRYAGWLPNFFLPVAPSLDRPSDYQPGWGVWVLLVGLAWSALGGRSLRSQLSLGVVVALVISFLRVPVLSDFWVAYMPRSLVAMVAFPLTNRLLPPLAAFTCVGGFLGLTELAARRVVAYRVFCGLLLALGGWGVWQAWPFLHHGWWATRLRQDTVALFRTENAVLDRYAYDLMRIPPYYSNGKTDPRLESRLFVRTKGFRIGPDEIARQMEAVDGREFLLTTAVEPTAPLWLNLAPVITLAPGEHLLLRFEFFDKDYRGWLVLRSEHIYRDYILPDSGWPLAFGVGKGRSKVLSLWNSGESPEEVHLSVQRSDPTTAGKAFGDFARLHVSHYSPELAPVRTLSWIPYRAEVDLPASGWLETPRAYLPGYEATVDGRPAPASESPRMVVRVPVAAGRHVVEVRFGGTRVFWFTWWVSAAAWLSLIGWSARRAFAGASGQVRPASGAVD
jgi:hypothetical protein